MCEDFNLKLEKNCRGCLTKNGEMSPIFNDENPDIPMMFESCTSIKISENDNCSFMCNTCLVQLTESYNFRQKCIQSDLQLSSLKEKILYGFRDENTLHKNTHIKDVTADVQLIESYQCDICKETFSIKENLIHHLFTCVNEVQNKNTMKTSKEISKNFPHMHSPKNDISANNLHSHTGDKQFRCKYCDEEFTKPSCLKLHLSIHTGEVSYLCSECGKKFTTKSGLKRHKISHSGERPYKCDQCTAKFISSSDLTVHMRVHTGERPYLCSICGSIFSRISHLNTHTRIHTGEKPYKCSMCGKAFVQAGDLRSHKRIHTGEKPYHCTICTKKFIQHSGLASHMRTHASDKSFQCTICKKAFSHSSSLARHKRYHCENPIELMSNNDKLV